MRTPSPKESISHLLRCLVLSRRKDITRRVEETDVVAKNHRRSYRKARLDLLSAGMRIDENAVSREMKSDDAWCRYGSATAGRK